MITQYSDYSECSEYSELLLHYAGAAVGVVQLAGLGDDALLAAVLNEHDGGADLRSHAAFGKVSLFEQFLGLGNRDGVQCLLVLLAEIDIHLGYIGEDVELVGTNLNGAQGAG